ncbi:hypothetical protein [Bacillus fungorum]|uniref:hypothetical protein n=1 Tax=Bacillus fungorum TaxID=2039284 RepID=UPI003F566E99
MNRLFKKELYDINRGYQAQVEDFKRKTELEEKLKLKDLERKCRIPHRIFELSKNAKIIGIEKNKRNEELFVFKQRGESYWAINGLPTISTKIYPALTGSKTPTSKFSGSKEVRWGINCP